MALTLAVVLCLVAYWALLLLGYHDMRQEVRVSNTRLANQSAYVLTQRVNAFFRKLDYFSRQLTSDWVDGDARLFERNVIAAMQSFTRPALIQVAVADSRGEVIFSRQDERVRDPGIPSATNIVDRPHFLAHATSESSFFYVGLPVLGRISNQWTIQFSRGIWHDGRFLGVVVLSVPADDLSAILTDSFPNRQDVALVARNDGAYLARSQGFDALIGSSVPSERAFVLDHTLKQGSYQATSGVDNIKRQYAWWRGEEYPFVVSVGHGERLVMATVEQAIQKSILQNSIGSVILVLMLLLAYRLWVLRRQQIDKFLTLQQRFDLVLQEGRLAAWEWDLVDDRLRIGQVWAKTLGEASGKQIYTFADWLHRTHPDDKARVQAECYVSLSQGSSAFDLEYRTLFNEGHYRWISDRGQVIERNAAGEPIRMAGIKQDITRRKEAQLAESELRQRLSKLVAEVPGAVIQFQRDPTGHYSFPFASPGLERIYGVTPEQVLLSAQPVFDQIVSQDRARIIESIERSADTLTDWRAQFRVQLVNGAVRWVAGHTRPEKLLDGTVIWYGYIHDVTADVEVAEALKDNEVQLRLTLQAVHDGLWSFDHRNQVVEWDDRIRSMLGYEDPQWDSPSWESVLGLLHPQDHDRLAVEAWDMFAHHIRDVLWLDFRLKTGDGQWLWVQARARVVEWDEHGMPARTVGLLTDISQRVAESQLRQALLNHSPAAIVLMNRERQFIDANERFRALFVPSGRSLKQINVSDMHVDRANYDKVGHAYEHMRQHDLWRVDIELKTVAGTTGWFDVQGVMQDPSDPESPVIWTIIDISARLEADQALRTERQRLRVLMERFPAGVLIEDSLQTVVFVNERWCDLMGLDTDPASMTELSRSEIRALVGEDRAPWFHQSAHFLSDMSSRAFEVQDGNGQYFEIEFLEVKQGEDPLGTVWFVWDITDRKRHENQLNRLALTDGLTALPNRRSFLATFEHYVQNADTKRPLRPGVLVMLDIDHFKNVNDTHGHAVGDMVLKQLAQTLSEQVGEHSCAARLGGEEFALLLPDVTLNHGIKIAQRVRNCVQQSTLNYADIAIQITISLGVTVINSNDLDVLLEQADKALYRAKQTGRNRVCVWGAEVS